MEPSVIPNEIARLAAVLGTLRIQSIIISGIPCHIICPNGICPSIIMTAAISRRVASNERARNALNAAEAIKNPIRENIVAMNGDMLCRNTQNSGDPSATPGISGKNPSHTPGSDPGIGSGLNHMTIEGKKPIVIAMPKHAKSITLYPHPDAPRLIEVR